MSASAVDVVDVRCYLCGGAIPPTGCPVVVSTCEHGESAFAHATCYREAHT